CRTSWLPPRQCRVIRTAPSSVASCNRCAKARRGLSCKKSCTRITSSQRSPEMLTRSNLRPLHRFPLVHTQSPDDFRQVLATRFGAVGFEVGAAATLFEIHRSYVQLKSVDLLYGACSAPYRVRFPSAAVIKQQFALRKAGRTTFGGRQF